MSETITLSNERQIPAWQQAIIDKCYHPSGAWEKFPESEYESSIPARFETIAARFPDRLAIVDDRHSLTYAELNAAANQIAHGLLEYLGDGPEPVVHLFEHSVEAVTALLGILKAGKFYVPLHIASPSAYLRGILEVMDSRLILTDLPNQDLALSAAGGQFDVCMFTDIAGQACDNPDVAVGPDDYLYVIFTSGSTGAPKGVIGNHRNALHLAAEYLNTNHVCVEDRHALFNRLSFSGSGEALYGSLVSGSSLFLYDIQQYGIQALPGWITRHHLTIITFTPPVFRLLADIVEGSAAFPSVRQLCIGGDRVLHSDLEAFWRLTSPSAIAHVGYSASESKVIADILYDRPNAGRFGDLPVGWPGSDVEILILDEDDNRLLPGEAGEIVARSRFVSPGYWGLPELTRRKFRPDPEKGGVFFYYTGDLGRIDDDGLVYHMGRIDSQVKIRGQRVELGTIERALLEMEEVREAAVAVRGETIPEERLLAWLVWTDPDQPLTVSELRRRLVERLPSYMVPAGFLSLEPLPLNANGKVDRQSLPLPDDHRPSLDSVYVPPRTPFELEITQVWADVLGFDRIGVHDDFFELGGDSIRAMQILSRLQRRLGSLLHIQAIFDAPTIAEMAIYLTISYMAENHNTDALSSDLWPTAGSNSSSTDTPVPIAPEDIALFRAHGEPTSDVEWRNRGRPEKNPRALFILAPPRSGTTLLRVMMAGHHHLFAPPELFLLNYTTLPERRRLSEGPLSHHLGGSVRALMALHDCTARDALEMMADYESQNLTTQDFYAALQTMADGRLLVDKTPLYASHLDILHRAEEWFDAPIYVHLSRHPCGMINSYVTNHFHLRSDHKSEFSPHQLAELIWLTYHENIEAFLKKIPTQRSLHIRYEDLAMEPDTAMSRTCNFLNIDFHTEMLTPYDDEKKRMTDGLYPGSTMIGDPTFHRFSQVSKASIDAWRQTLHHDMLSPQSKQMASRLGYGDL